MIGNTNRSASSSEPFGAEPGTDQINRNKLQNSLLKSAPQAQRPEELFPSFELIDGWFIDQLRNGQRISRLAALKIK